MPSTEPIDGIQREVSQNLGAPARRALAQAGVTSLEELSRRTEREIANLHGMGPKGIRILKEAMAQRGYRFVDLD